MIRFSTPRERALIALALVAAAPLSAFLWILALDADVSTTLAIAAWLLMAFVQLWRLAARSIPRNPPDPRR